MSRKLSCSRGYFDVDTLKQELAQIKNNILDSNLWNDRDQAQSILKRETYLTKIIEHFLSIERDCISLKELFVMSEAGELSPEEQTDLTSELNILYAKTSKLEIESLFSKEGDNSDCFLEIHAGAGGTESHDWAEMLSRMYLRFAESQDFNCAIVHELKGEEAGVKSVTIKISGANAYGWFKTESGIHRLVRISPFNAAGKRQTSFASVWVYPIVDDNIEIKINEGDLRVDTYRSSGAGGQHVNTTDSAVRITHIPTNIVVQCQNDRSQHRNRDEAMRMLKSRLYQRELKMKENAIQEQNDAKSSNSWGNQIRSYVLHPYRMVKDHRTECETSDADGVLEGNLKAFVLASLSNKEGK